MKFLSWFFIFVLLLNGCDQLNSSGTTDLDSNTAGNKDPLYVGHWLSDCLTGQKRIYTEISKDLKVKIAYLDYSGVHCTGTYQLTDGTNAIEEPIHVQNISEENVKDIPSNFFVLKYSNIADLNTQYVIMYANDTEHFDLTGFTSPHSTWSQWQGEADVYGFSQNPVEATPSTHELVHFNRSELP